MANELLEAQTVVLGSRDGTGLLSTNQCRTVLSTEKSSNWGRGRGVLCLWKGMVFIPGIKEWDKVNRQKLLPRT